MEELLAIYVGRIVNVQVASSTLLIGTINYFCNFKYFCLEFSCVNGLAQSPQPFNKQNLKQVERFLSMLP